MGDVVAGDGHVYNKSSSANATEAPTSGATEQNLEDKVTGRSEGLNADQMEFVTFMAQYFAVQGKLMEATEAVEKYHFEYDEFLDFMTNTKVSEALAERGIVTRGISTLKKVDQELKLIESSAVGDENEIRGDSNTSSVLGNVCSNCGRSTSNSIQGLEVNQEEPGWKINALTPQQLIVANIMLDLVDTRSEKKKLQDLGVSTLKYQMWLKDPVFNQYLVDRAESMMGESQHQALLALQDKVRMGDLPSIKLYLEMTGRFVQQTTAVAGTTPMADFKVMLTRLIEIISDEVHDPQVAGIISDRIQGLISANVVAGQLVASTQQEIIVPEVMPNRALTPRLQALMEKGEGSI